MMTYFILLFCVNLNFSVHTYCSIFFDLLFEVPFSYNNNFLLYFIFIYYLLSFFLYLTLFSLHSFFFFLPFYWFSLSFSSLVSLPLSSFPLPVSLPLPYFFYSNRRMTEHLRNVGPEFLRWFLVCVRPVLLQNWVRHI